MSIRRVILVACVALAAATALPALALAAFPYPAPSGNPTDYSQFKVGDQTPNDLGGNTEWMYSATPEDPGADPLVAANNASPFELGGIRGAHLVDKEDSVQTAWETTTGRPDVAIAVLDSGIKWDDRSAMIDLRKKTRISKGEAKVPKHTRTTPSEPLPGGKTCADFADAFDANGDGVFNVSDYACDRRVQTGPDLGVGPDDLLDPQDVLIAFSDGVDDDGNGFKDDMVGWDFLDNDNDPYDDVQYGHGTGEARDSNAESDNGTDGGGAIGTCPNCMVVPMRVGDSFVADVNRFAQAAIYAADNNVLVIQEALGTLNNSKLARQAVKYAYDHGVAVIASAADEAAQHNNWPSSLPGVILVNSVTQYDTAITPNSRSYLQFNGCTNFNAKITVAIPSVSCSSDATGRGSGMAGIIYSAALNGVQGGALQPHPGCTRTNGQPCPITPNEVRQLMASGKVDGQTQADDVNFEPTIPPPVACPEPNCTDPFGSSPLLTLTRPIVSPLATTKSYPARFGPDQFYGYGRVNMFRAAKNAADGVVPPEVEITSPEWFQQIDPTKSTFQVRGSAFARGQSFKCEVYVAPGTYPNERTTTAGGDYKKVASTECDGAKTHTAKLDGVLADVDVNDLESRFPPTAGSFNGRETGTAEAVQPYSGRPNTEPYGFYVKVVATSVQGGKTLQGEDRRQMQLHRDKDLLPGFPVELGTDGASSPLFVDLDGDNRNELVFGTSDGFVHAMKRDGSELTGWPVRGDALPVHGGGRAFDTGEVSSDYGGAILASPAAGDLNRDGVPEIVAADLEGHVYAWNSEGRRVFGQEADPKFSGKPITPFDNVRKGKRSRTQHGFLGSPVLGDLDRDGKPEIVAAAMDRHLYAWRANGDPVSGFPVEVVDRGKVQSIDPTTHAVVFDDSKTGPDALNQGAIVDTPAVANVTGAADSPPEIVVGTNEEYRINEGNEGDFNGGALNNLAVQALQQAGSKIGFGVANANGRVYAIHADGGDHPGGPFVTGWPVKLGLLMSELLPVVGEGVNGSPVVAPLTCPLSGGSSPAPKVGVIPAAGLGYILNADGGSCLGKDGAKDRGLDSDVPLGTPGGTGLDATRFPAVGLPAFGEVAGQTAFLAPVAGVIRALDLAANEYQGGVDGMGAYNPQTGKFLPGFPAQVNDLSFLTGPAVADVGGLPGEEVLAGTASMDLQAFNGAPGTSGQSTSGDWPKLSGDWMVATPLAGSFGQKETAADAKKVVVAITRRGTVFAYDTTAGPCSAGSSPRFHHDNANSGDYKRDAVAPGAPEDVRIEAGALRFRAPGDDLLCGIADHYELVQSGSPIDGGNIDSAEKIPGAPAPAAPGTMQQATLPAAKQRYVALRALDEQGNPGRTVALDTSTAGGSGGPGGGGNGGGGGGKGAGKHCVPSRVGVSGSRIGPARLGGSLRALERRYRVARRSRRAVRFCVRGGGRFLVSARRGRIVLIASTARRHGTRQTAPGRRLRGNGVKGARRLSRTLLLGRRPGRGRVLYGTRHGRLTFVVVVPRGAATHPRALTRRLGRLGLR